MTTTRAPRGAADPDRAARIIDAALDVIAERGVSGTTHRTIAARAGVPLGSLTYHFAGLDDIIRRSFAHLSAVMAADYDERMAGAADLTEACEQITTMILGEGITGHREIVLLREMYAYANRDEDTARLVSAWMLSSRASLSRWFSPGAARAVDALLEGWSIHQAAEGAVLERALIVRTLEAIAAATPARR